MTRATIATDIGDIEVDLYDQAAPKATKNFIDLANKGFYDDVIFHRVIPGFVIQGGDGQFGKKAALERSRVGTGGPGRALVAAADPGAAQRRRIHRARHVLEDRRQFAAGLLAAIGLAVLAEFVALFHALRAGLARGGENCHGCDDGPKPAHIPSQFQAIGS